MHTTEKPYIEFLDGELHRKVTPKRTHAIVQGAMLRILYACAGHRGSVGTEWDFRLGVVDETHTVLVPDVAFVTRERLQALSKRDREEPPFSPDVVVEVRSPSNDARYRERKITRYLATGAIAVLDVDPPSRTITVHEQGLSRVFGEQERLESLALPWLSFDVAKAFEDLED